MFANINQFFLRLVNFLILAVRLYQEKSCQKSAGSLTYVTLFAIVPLITVCYSMFSIIPAFKSVGDQFQALIFSHLLPSNEGLIIKYLNNFTLQARKLTAFGVMFLMVSAYFMLKNIEKNFNDIWSVPHERRGVANFLLYWAILSLGPLLIGLAVLMNTYLMSLRIFVDHYDSYNLIDQVFEWMPWLLTSAAFTLLYIAVPNCKVPVGHAVLGGVLTLLVFELVKKGFSLMVSHSSLNFIYGAFAVVPLFLLWLNLSWMIILGGAVFVRSIGLHQIHLKDRHYPDLFGCLLVLWQFHVASFKGDSVRNTQLLHLGLSTTQWQRIREMLLNNKIITSNQQNEYVLCRDLARLHISELNEWLGVGHRLPDDQSALADLPWLAHAQYHLGGMDQLEGERLGLSVEDFFDIAPTTPNN